MKFPTKDRMAWTRRPDEHKSLLKFSIASILLILSFFLSAVDTAKAAGFEENLAIRSLVDSNGVNLIDGTFHYTNSTISVGVPGSGGLSQTYYRDQNYNHEALSGRISVSGSTYLVSVGRSASYFSPVGASFASLQGDGSTLTKTNATTYTWVARDGTVGVFSTTLAGTNEDTPAIARITSLTFPNKEARLYTYSAYSYTAVTGTPQNPGSIAVSGYRLEAVTNNYGYEIKFLYRTTGVTGNTSQSNVYVTQMLAINNAVDYCAPTATACAGLTVAWPSLSFNCSTTCTGVPFNGVWAGGNVKYSVVTSVTDSLGRITKYPGFPIATATLLKPSGETITIKSDAAGRVSSVSNGVGTWSYAYVDSGSTRTTTVTDPLTHTRVVTSDTTKVVVLADADGLSHTTSYGYDTFNRLNKVTHPEGDFVTFDVSNRGNVSQTVVTGKDLTSTITTSAGFDALCTSLLKCNQPNWTKDGRGNQTDYTYDATTGQIATINPPAGANGLRPEIDFTYTNLYAYYKSAGGVITQASTPMSMLTRISRCVNAQTCASTANAIEDNLTYGTPGVANNLLVTSVAQGAGNSSLIASTQVAYDSIGNVYTVTDPLLHVSRYRFDATRQLVGIVGPDPDGGGSLPNRATRITYQCDSTITAGCDGVETKVEQGTVPSQSDTDWTSNFTVREQKNTTYDTADRIAKEVDSNGGTAISAFQYTYDAANRLTCRAQRMNPAATANMPASACSLGTQGSAGPDRITAYSYDNADRVQKITVGYGSTVQADSVVNTYGNNGEIQTQADGKGHLTTYVFDTFNRAYQIHFPTPSNGSVSSSTDYEQYTLDENGNVTQNRRRDGTLVNYGYDALNLRTSGYSGATFAYDNVGRMTSAVVTGASETFGYDALNRQTSETGPLGTVSRKFDLAGNLIRLTYPDNYYVTYVYDSTDGVKSLTDPSSVSLLQQVYDSLGRVISITRNGGPSESRSYGADLKLASQAYTFADSSKNVSYSYTYNMANQPLTMTPNNTAFRNVTTPSAMSYASDGQNRYTTVGGHNLAYDGRSNLSNDGTNSFAFDGLNRTTTINSSTLNYDALDRLIKTTAGSTANRLAYSGQQAIAVYDAAGSLLNRYVPDVNVDRTLLWFSGSSTAVSGANWLVTNAFGSVIAGASSATAAITTYDAFGVTGASGLSAANGNLGFKGLISAGSAGIYHSRARTYNAALGRFLQPDPAGYLDAMNYYSFVNNDPVGKSDPSGLGCFSVNYYTQGTPGFPLSGIPVTSGSPGTYVFCEDGHPAHPTSPPAPGKPTTPPKRPQTQSLKPVQDWLCHAGNSLASASATLGNASGTLELVGVGVGVAGLFTAQPEVAGPGFFLAAAGGIGSIGAGALQFGAGLLQGFGGGGFGNSFSAVATLGAGATIGRFITGPSVSGYQTVSQRATNSFLQNTATTTGGVFDTLTSFIEQLGPQQVVCP